MAQVLALSSHVARGHVGLAAITPALGRLGHEVLALPTVLLSNHPGHPHRAGLEVPSETLDAMIQALDANGWLHEVDAVLTGYLPSEAHVCAAARAIETVRARRPDALIACDPILGDLPGGLYIDERAARLIRDRLLPLANLASPNAFELAWLSGKAATDVESAVAAARTLPCPEILVTSVPGPDDHLASVLVLADRAYAASVKRLEHAPHGTGDFMMALLLAERLAGRQREQQLGSAVAATAELIAESTGKDELAVVTAAARWHAAQPQVVERV